MVKVSLFKKNYCSCTKQVSWTSYILPVTCTYYFCCIIRRSRCLPFIFFSLLNNLALALFRSVIRGSRCLPFLSNLEVRLLFKAFGLFFLKCSAVLCRALSWEVMLTSPCFMLTICPRRESWQYIETCLWHTVLGIIHYFFVKRCDSYCCRVAVSKFSYKQVGNF